MKTKTSHCTVSNSEKLLYAHLQHHNDTIIKTDTRNDKDAMIKTQEDFFNNIYLSLYCKGTKGLLRGCV